MPEFQQWRFKPLLERSLALPHRSTSETPGRFGEGNRLFGMLFEPKGLPGRGATLVILPTAHAREFWQDELHKVAMQFPPKA